MKDAYYVPFTDSSFYYAYTYIEAQDPNTGQVLHASPYLLLKPAGVIEQYLPGAADPPFTTSGNEYHLGQGPPRWFGSFANNATQVTIAPALTNYAGLWLFQNADRRPYEALPYQLYRAGMLIASSTFPVAQGGWEGLTPATISLPASGHYTLGVTYNGFWTDGEPSQAQVVADFDTSRSDKDPPTLLALNVLQDGETTDLVSPSGMATVRFRVDDPGGLGQVSLSYRSTGAWTALPLTLAGLDYTGQLPALSNGTLVSLQIVAGDAAGNMLTYEVEPAFRAGRPPPALVSPTDGWVTGEHDVTFVWKPLTWAASYRIQIDTGNAFDSPSLIEHSLTGTSYTAYLALGTWYWRVLARDGAGNESAFSPAWRLTIAGPLVQVTTDPGDDGYPAMTQAADGILWVAWTSSRYGSGFGDLWYKTSSDGGATWSAETRLTTDSGNDGYPAMTRAADGTLWVVWIRNSYLWYKTSSDGGATWSAETRLTNDPDTLYYPAVAQAADGKLWVVWESYRSGNWDLWYKTSSDGGATWSAETQLTTDPSDDGDPAIAQAADGTLWVVWASHRAIYGNLWYKTSSDGGATWSAETRLTSYPGNDAGPAIAQAADGTLWVTWSSDRFGNPDLWYKTSTDGGATWSAETRFTRFVGMDWSPAMVALSSGRVGLSWRSDRSGNGDIWFGIPGEREDINPPPYVEWVQNQPGPNPDSDDVITFRARASDETGVANVSLVWTLNGTAQSDLVMHDDGAHGDDTAGDSVYGVQIAPLAVGSQVTYRVRASDTDDNIYTSGQGSFQVLAPFVKTADILFVPDYGGSDTTWFRRYYVAALDGLGYHYDVWDTGLRGEPDSATLNLYTGGAVIWAVPLWNYTAATTLGNLRAYLDASGKLFITGQNIAEQLSWAGFLNNYLHASYVQMDTGLFALGGAAGDPIGDGLALNISGGDGANDQYWKNEVDPIAPAQIVFTYQAGASRMLAAPVRQPEQQATPVPASGGRPGAVTLPTAEAATEVAGPAGAISSGTAGLRVDTGTYKVVYFAFGFEGINSAADRATVMDRALAWLGVDKSIASVTVEPSSAVTLTLPGGAGQILLPTGLVTGTTNFTYTEMLTPTQATGGFAFAGQTFTLNATDAAGQPITTFAGRYTITLNYQDSDWQAAGIPAEENLNLYYWNGTAWVAVLPCAGCSLDTVNNQIIAVLDHLTEFALLGSPLAAPTVSGRKESNGVELHWTQTQAGVIRYEVYRSTNPYLTPADGQKLAPDVTSPGLGDQATFVDTGAFDPPLTNYYYVVVAVGADEAKSSASNPVGAFHFSLTPGAQ